MSVSQETGKDLRKLLVAASLLACFAHLFLPLLLVCLLSVQVSILERPLPSSEHIQVYDFHFNAVSTPSVLAWRKHIVSSRIMDQCWTMDQLAQKIADEEAKLLAEQKAKEEAKAKAIAEKKAAEKAKKEAEKAKKEAEKKEKEAKAKAAKEAADKAKKEKAAKDKADSKDKKADKPKKTEEKKETKKKTAEE